MNSYRKIARLVGVLYIIGTVSGILSMAFTGPLLNTPDTVAKVATEVSTHEDQLRIGALFVLTMGLALAAIPVLLFPVLKKQDEILALGYVVFRGALETVTYMASVISMLLFIPFSQEYVAASVPDAVLGTMLLDAGEAIGHLMTFVFIPGAVMFYYVLYRSRLVPRWLSGWGLIGAVPFIAADLLALFTIVEQESTIQVLLYMPLAIQEMVLAIWLIVKGFNPSVIADASA